MHASPKPDIEPGSDTTQAHQRIPVNNIVWTEHAPIEGEPHSCRNLCKARSESPNRSSPQREIAAFQEGTLSALAIGAPLIASVVVGCLGVMVPEIQSAFGSNPRERPSTAQATIALMWSAIITSLGSAMIAVAGLTMSACYDSHVGLTQALRISKPSNVGNDASTPSRCIIEVEHHVLQRVCLRAAEISIRLLGVSLVLFVVALFIHIFSLYPKSVAISAFIVAFATAMFAAVPVVPLIFSTNQQMPHNKGVI